MKIDPPKEWQQIFNDGWRIFRDWFYSENLHGVDWEKMRQKYGQLVPYLGHRADLDFIFGELVGEINCRPLPTSTGAISPRLPRLDTGLLGAELKADEKAGRYRHRQDLCRRELERGHPLAADRGRASASRKATT